MIKYHQTLSKTYTAKHTQKQSKTHNAWKDSFLLTYNLGLLMFDTVNKIKLYTTPVYPPPAPPKKNNNLHMRKNNNKRIKD